MTPRPEGPGTGPGRLSSAVVIGTGLIGTSIALALCEQGVTVWLADHDPAAARLAADLGAGEVLPEPLGAAERGQDASEEAGFPLLGLALALCGSNRLSSLVRRPKRRRKLPVPPLLGNCCDHPEGDEVLPGVVEKTFVNFYCALSQLPSRYPQ